MKYSIWLRAHPEKSRNTGIFSNSWSVVKVISDVFFLKLIFRNKRERGGLLHINSQTLLPTQITHELLLIERHYYDFQCGVKHYINKGRNTHIKHQIFREQIYRKVVFQFYVYQVPIWITKPPPMNSWASSSLGPRHVLSIPDNWLTPFHLSALTKLTSSWFYSIFLPHTQYFCFSLCPQSHLALPRVTRWETVLG